MTREDVKNAFMAASILVAESAEKVPSLGESAGSLVITLTDRILMAGEQERADEAANPRIVPATALRAVPGSGV